MASEFHVGFRKYSMPSKLLVIDDTVLHLAILARVAAQEGLIVTAASSFAEAASLVSQVDFDCITLDLSLGERTGLEVLHLLSKTGFRAPIIVISGSENSACLDTVQKGKRLGLNLIDPIPKPINLAVLRNSFRQVVAGVHRQKLAVMASE